MTTILLVEDEEAYRDALAFNLRRDGFEVHAVGDGSDALVAFARHNPDLVLLDLMLPGLSGTEVCKELRRHSGVPVIMLTAKDAEIDKVLGLELGADDYVTKPYSYRELLARIRAVLRRGTSDPSASVLKLGRIVLDSERHVVKVDGRKVSMPLREFELLELLMRNPDRVLTRPQIIERIWGPEYDGPTKTLDVHIGRIRSKIERDTSNPTTLITVRGLGYKLIGDSED